LILNHLLKIEHQIVEKKVLIVNIINKSGNLW